MNDGAISWCTRLQEFVAVVRLSTAGRPAAPAAADAADATGASRVVPLEIEQVVGGRLMALLLLLLLLLLVLLLLGRRHSARGLTWRRSAGRDFNAIFITISPFADSAVVSDW